MVDTSEQKVINTTEQLSANHNVHESDKAALTMGAFGSALVFILSFISSNLHL